MEPKCACFHDSMIMTVGNIHRWAALRKKTSCFLVHSYQDLLTFMMSIFPYSNLHLKTLNLLTPKKKKKLPSNRVTIIMVDPQRSCLKPQPCVGHELAKTDANTLSTTISPLPSIPENQSRLVSVEDVSRRLSRSPLKEHSCASPAKRRRISNEQRDNSSLMPPPLFPSTTPRAMVLRRKDVSACGAGAQLIDRGLVDDNVSSRSRATHGQTTGVVTSAKDYAHGPLRQPQSQITASTAQALSSLREAPLTSCVSPNTEPLLDISPNSPSCKLSSHTQPSRHARDTRIGKRKAVEVAEPAGSEPANLLDQALASVTDEEIAEWKGWVELESEPVSAKETVVSFAARCLETNGDFIDTSVWCYCFLHLYTNTVTI